MGRTNEEIFSKINFGVITDLINEEDITDVTCKNGNEVWITSNTRGHKITDLEINEAEIQRIASQIANKMGKEFNPSEPNLEGDIQGEEFDMRIACGHQYLAPEGSTIAIRKVRKKAFLTYETLISDNYITKEALDMLIKAMRGRANIFVVGETGTGKTELLKFLSTYIPINEVMVTIEDSLEFNVKKINPKASVTSFRIRPKFGYRKVIAMAMRLNVQRIWLQEARNEEVGDLIDAMSTGHNVCTTMHARGAGAVISRIKQMLKDENETFDSLRNRVYALVDIVIYIDKVETAEGVFRQINTITEFCYDNSKNISSDNIIYTAEKGIINGFSDELNNIMSRNLRGI